MCGRFSYASEFRNLLDAWGLLDPGWTFGPKYNVAPGQMIPAVMAVGEQRRVELLKWGLVPFWAKDATIGNSMINARSESVFDKPAFKRLILRQRCIVPADGFYEWKHTEDGKKTPYRMVLRQRKLFGFAGLYDTWKSPDGDERKTCTILTTRPNELMAPLHNRMPVILAAEAEAAWLSDDTVSREMLERMMAPYRAEEMIAYPVSTAVGNVKNDTRDLIDPVSI